MNNRVFTVGSLIPGKITPVLYSPPSSLIVKGESKRQSSDSKTQLEKIIVVQGSNTFEIAPAKGKLLDVALNQGKPIKYKCRKGTCGQCTVHVLQDSGLSQPNEQEHTKLGNEVNHG
ncbi:MAG: 2Fe-2S iron-sulfur cluster-binding protein, partial [Bacillus sp. (in: firmicutes)]